MKVCKFGGSSLADAAGVGRACDIVRADPERRVVVVSAPGRRYAGDDKVTDLLIACAGRGLEGKPADALLAAVAGRFREVQEALGLPAALSSEIEADVRRRLQGDRSHRERFIDTLKAAGEDGCARLVAAALAARGVDARYLDPGQAGLLLSDEYGNAQLLEESYENLAALREAQGVTVFPGFFGYTREGYVVTFPRGGSDITGAIVAAAVNAELYENFTDVDSVFSADPRLVPDAAPISELTYREMRELSYAGFDVLHDEAIVPAVQAGVPICIKNTHRPEGPGTTIVPEHRQAGSRVVGIASSGGFCTIYVSKYLMNREIGFGRRVLQVLEDEALSYEHMPSGIDNLSLVVAESDLDAATEARVVGRLRGDLAASDVSVERGLALVMLVGEGMRYHVGLAARATRALAEADVNIEMLNQGSSEISMMFGVKAEARERAVRALYDAFFRNPA
ncbi:MAG: aspartate kinase [Lentisphaerae bacterium]|nr:aspartate kinase [Lentisphaerota bacterium]